MSTPKHVAIARKYLGTREIVGEKNSPVIMGWIKRLGRKLGVTINDDETAWCGTFIAQVMDEAGYSVPKIPVRAKAWGDYGWPVKPQVGAIGVKSRIGGGHVFIIVGITSEGKYYLGIGGNQNNMVSIAPVKVEEVTAFRWPVEVSVPNIPLPVMPRGTVVSEA